MQHTINYYPDEGWPWKGGWGTVTYCQHNAVVHFRFGPNTCIYQFFIQHLNYVASCYILSYLGVIQFE